MVTLTDQNFDQEVLKADLPVLVDFYADWCGPCQMYGPIIEEIAKDFEGKIKVGKMDVDKNQATPAKYNVMSIPTTLLINGGKILKQWVGVQPKEALSKEIEAILGN